MVQSFLVTMKEMECRKCTPQHNVWADSEGNEHESSKLEVQFDDIECNRIVLYDKNMEHESNYVRGKVGTVTLKITTEVQVKMDKKGRPYPTEKTSIFIEDFTAKKGNKS